MAGGLSSTKTNGRRNYNDILRYESYDKQSMKHSDSNKAEKLDGRTDALDVCVRLTGSEKEGEKYIDYVVIIKTNNKK